MNTTLKLLLFVAISGSLLVACSGNTPPPLAVEGQPTLVYFYTDA